MEGALMGTLDGFLTPVSPREVALRVTVALAKGAGVLEACTSERISPAEYARMRAEDAELQAAHEAALAQSYENEARKRVMEGVSEDTYDANGTLVKKVVKKDTGLLVKLLEAHDPRYRTSGAANVTIDMGKVLDMVRERRKGERPT